MDIFKMPSLNITEEIEAAPSLEEIKERRKFYECAQFDCLPRHLGKAVAMKNYWVYLYDIFPK